MKRYIGIDLHKDNFTVCYLDLQNRQINKKYKLNSLNWFKKTLNQEDEIAVEAVANSRFFCEEIVNLVEKVVLVAPSKFTPISDSVKKTDKLDAQTLARYLKMDELPRARIMNKQQAIVKSLLKARNKFVKHRTQCKNKIHNVLSSHGILMKTNNLFSKKGFEYLKNLNVDPLVKIEIESLIKQIECSNESINDLEAVLKKPENQLPGHQNLISITGIGDIGAATILSGIGNIEDFPDKKKLNAYFGLVPIVRRSNNSTYYGRITKHGSQMVRSALVQCALTIIKYNPILRSFYLKLKEKKGSGKAIIATARKLLEFIHYTLTNNITWEDSNHSVIKSQA